MVHISSIPISASVLLGSSSMRVRVGWFRAQVFLWTGSPKKSEYFLLVPIPRKFTKLKRNLFARSIMPFLRQVAPTLPDI